MCLPFSEIGDEVSPIKTKAVILLRFFVAYFHVSFGCVSNNVCKNYFNSVSVTDLPP